MFFTEPEKDRMFLEGFLLIASDNLRKNKKLNLFQRIIVYWTVKIFLFVLPALNDKAVYYLVYKTGIKFKFDELATKSIFGKGDI